MKIDVYNSTGTKTGTRELPAALFGVRVNNDLMHQAFVMQQGNRRRAIAHAKKRSEVVGSTKKIFAQKGTGRARRGPARSPVMRGGGKAFGPKKEQNFSKDMPRSMRHAAMASALTFKAKEGAILGLESYPDTIKTKTFYDLLKKLPMPIGRHLLFVVPERHHALWMSSRNVHRVKIVQASYLNPEDVLRSWAIAFVGDSIEKAVETFAKEKKARVVFSEEKAPAAPKAPKAPKAAKAPKKTTTKKVSAKKSA